MKESVGVPTRCNELKIEVVSIKCVLSFDHNEFL